MSALIDEYKAGSLECRITIDDLKPFNDSVLKAARTMNLLIQETEGNISMPFWAALNARRLKAGLAKINRLNTVEREFITEYVDREVKHVDNIVNIVDYMLQTPDACMKEEGVVFEKNMAARKMIQPVLPADEIGKIGGQLVAGLLVASFARENKAVKPTEPTVLAGYSIPDVNETGFAKFQTALLPSLQQHFAGKESIGKGRPYISEIFSYLRSMSMIEYYAIQHRITITLLAGCFEFNYIKKVEGKNRIFKHQVRDSQPFISSVKDRYKDCFLQLTVDNEAVEEFIALAHLRGPFFVWCKGLPTRTEIEHEPLDNFAAAHKHLQASRTFRGSDESGLSAWTSSFLACPGYNKEHLSVCRVLSLILGAAKDGSVYVHGTSESFRMKLCPHLERRQCTKIFFVVDKNSQSTSAYAAYYVLVEPARTKATKSKQTTVYIIDSPMESAKEENWKEVDGKAQLKIASYLTGEVGRVALLTHVQSDLWFKQKFNIGSPTSLHSMYAVVANYPVLFAASNGFGAKLDYLPMTNKSRASFLDAVLAHNLSRNLSFLYPAYYCNPRMNLLTRGEVPKLTFRKVKVGTEGSGVDYDEKISKTNAPLSDEDYIEVEASDSSDNDDDGSYEEEESDNLGQDPEQVEEERRRRENSSIGTMLVDAKLLPEKKKGISSLDADFKPNFKTTTVVDLAPVQKKKVPVVDEL